MNETINNATARMEKSISSLGQAFNKIRTGRANPAILDDIKIDYYGNLSPLSITNCDVVIDFSRPESSLKILNQCLENKIPLVIGTTGFNNDQVQIIKEASKNIPLERL